ncbi:hypothetical protein, partial [Rhodococcus rhodochrous]|uniref:hypothetical protein n=1 Tax=Rhodococcus rhodochrous TaxID=1829 RepID=UPI0021BD8245
MHAQHVVPVEDGGDDRPQRRRVQAGGQAQQQRLRIQCAIGGSGMSPTPPPGSSARVSAGAVVPTT